MAGYRHLSGPKRSSPEPQRFQTGTVLADRPGADLTHVDAARFHLATVAEHSAEVEQASAATVVDIHRDALTGLQDTFAQNVLLP